MFAIRKYPNPWEGQMEPFKILGNVYFVGTYQASSHLVDTGDGLILIDAGPSSTLHLVVDSIYKLGFKPTDIKYIINTHWHWDHTEGTAALAFLSGAKTLIGKEDAEKAKRYFNPDILLSDGDTLSLDNTTIEFMETPGHTKGTVSFFFNITDNGKTYRVGMFGGAGANTLVRGKFDFEGCREAYRNSLHRLMKEKVDIFIGNHTWNNNTYHKSITLRETGENLFIDDKIWNEFLTFCEKRLDGIICDEEESEAASK